MDYLFSSTLDMVASLRLRKIKEKSPTPWYCHAQEGEAQGKFRQSELFYLTQTERVLKQVGSNRNDHIELTKRKITVLIWFL